MFGEIIQNSMKESTILKLALLLTVIGLLFLFFYTENVNLEAVERIDTALPEETVKMVGLITKLTVKENVVFITLEGQRTEKVDVVLFPDHELFLNEGDYIEILGTVEEYKGKKEIIASSITLK
jgi:transcriptional antiterminator